MKLIPLLLSLLPLAALGAAPSSQWPYGPFGIGGDYHSNFSAAADAKWIPQVVSIGVKSHRTANTGWEAIEPAPGQWSWDNLDSQMAYLESQHIIFGGIFAGNPQWNSTDDPQGLPVNNIAGWEDYVSHTVSHVKGRIKYWEVWNEPPNGAAPTQTAADYAKIVVASYDSAKAADPRCLIGLATKSVDVNYLYQAILAGAKDHFDYITLHPYETLGGVVDSMGAEPVFMSIVPTVRKMLRDVDPARANVPIILTEIGCDAGASGPYAKGPAAQAYALIKAYTMGIAQGMACIDWFEGMDGDSGPMGILQANGTPRPSYTAYGQLIHLLGNDPTYLGWLTFGTGGYGFVFQGAKGAVLSAWASRGAPDQIDFGQQVSLIDPLTGTVTKSSTCTLAKAPVLVDGVPARLTALARANKSRPFPWGGDYTNAKSVSITMGAVNQEQGLHTQAAASIASDVVAYGGPARSGSIPGGNVFIVDPNFLSYTTTPIQITVEVRRDENNDNAGFKLSYESVEGIKDINHWYTIPDNKSWHTVTYLITDPQFVSMWGFNFSLNSDGNTYNKYYIRSVTLTKPEK